MSTPRLAHSENGSADFDAFLASFRERLRHAVHVRGDIDRLSADSGLPAHVMREIRAEDPFSAFIPEEFGGRGGHIHEGLGVLTAVSYESLPLSVLFAINWVLFAQPVTKYGHDEVKGATFDRILRDKHLAGFMLTEPDFGSDALNIETAYVEHEDHYHIEGTKHWGGLTGWADCWLLAARERRGDRLHRDIDFFICDVNLPGQYIEVEEMYENLGLRLVPYGLNKVDVRVPKNCRLQPKRSGTLMMVDLLHRSRMEFPGMGMGFLHRLLDEALEHCKQRHVGGSSLFSYDQVQHRLARIQAAFTVCSAMCIYSSDNAQLENDLSRRGLEANAIKAVLTDLMQDASQSLLQLVGAKGFRLDHIAGRATVDSRPFQIFEGSNDILYQQIAEKVINQMRQVKESNLLEHLSSLELTRRASEYLDDLLAFEIDYRMPQRKQVQLGRALGRIISLQLVLELGDRGFRRELIRGAVSELRERVSSLLSGYRDGSTEDVVDDYGEESSWLRYANAPAD